MQSFVANDQRVVGDTEVFHARCVANIPRSLTNRLKLRVIELTEKTRHLEHDRQEVSRLRIAIDASNADARNVRAENDRLTRELHDLRSTVRVHDLAMQNREAEVAAVRRIADARQQRIEALEREVALHQTIQGARAEAPTTPTTPVTKPDPQQETKDDTEKRFSLLELD